jgi:uncharacterized repeat protein (TIGR04138 family)
MPPLDEPANQKTLHDVVEQVGTYPMEAYDFLQRALTYTVHRVHGSNPDPKASRHVSGKELCQGLRELALLQWGYMARTVLRHWNINGTIDFGRMVFALVENGLMQKTEQDTLDDFQNVFDFKSALEGGYCIHAAPRAKGQQALGIEAKE